MRASGLLARAVALALLALVPASAVALYPLTGHTGEVWIFASGIQSCEKTVLGPGSPIFYEAENKLWIHEGETAVFEGTADQVFVLAWTMRTSQYETNARWSAVGNMAAACEPTQTPWGPVYAFVNGMVTLEPEG